MEPIELLLSDSAWDEPFFKVLARNDTGNAPGHQAGIVIPVELRAYFPTLDIEDTSSDVPTVDRRVHADLLLGTRQLGYAEPRYQFQTWGGKRNPESRLTGNLSLLRDVASGGDVLLFQRRAESLDQFRLVLIRNGSGDHAAIQKHIGSRRWGPLFQAKPPATTEDIERADREISALAQKPFSVLRDEIERTESRLRRIVRCTVFPERVLKQYRYTCSVSGLALETPANKKEVQAAHVVPVSAGGTDDVRNGLALTQTLHWAFDRGLFGVMPDKRIVVVPGSVAAIAGNEFLRRFNGKTIAEASTPQLRVHPDAFHWHLQNVVSQWM